MKCFIARRIEVGFDDAISRVTTALENEGFAVVTDIDVAATLKWKTGVEFRPYRILGTGNPPLAHKAPSIEDKVDVIFPNVIIHAVNGDAIEIAAVNPRAAMERSGSPALARLAAEVADRLTRAVNAA